MKILTWLLPFPARRDSHSAGFDFEKELLELWQARERQNCGELQGRITKVAEEMHII